MLESRQEMVYIKSILVGFAAAAMTMIAWFVGEMTFTGYSIAQTGSGGIGAVVIVSYVPLLVGMAAFALGFYFMLRRLKLRGISK
jgi:hypothetical protein